jgi:hypothetical protein
MITKFKSEYSQHDAFYLRGNLLREKFGDWDCLDPVGDAILDLVAAQNALADVWDETTYREVPDVEFAVAIEERHAAAERVMRVLNDRDSWPDPTLGQR